ncbi:hypothetical protein [Thermodesulfatator indicus]
MGKKRDIVKEMEHLQRVKKEAEERLAAMKKQALEELGLALLKARLHGEDMILPQPIEERVAVLLEMMGEDLRSRKKSKGKVA